MLGDVTREFEQNEYSCDVQDISPSLTLTDAMMNAEEHELSSSEVLNTNLPSASSTIVVNGNHTYSTYQASSLNSTREKRHVCEHCEKEFRWKSDLIRHVYSHTGERPYSCDHCEYKCANKSNLTKHIRTHTGEKPFSCDVCGKSFALSGHLKRHYLTHTGDKQHRCDQCGEKFIWKSNLERHLLTHNAV